MSDAAKPATGAAQADRTDRRPDGSAVRVMVVDDEPSLAELARPRPRPRLRADLERWAGLVERRGACHHPDGSVRFLSSTLAIFGTELTAHARGECSATSHRPFLPVPAGVPASQADWI